MTELESQLANLRGALWAAIFLLAGSNPGMARFFWAIYQNNGGTIPAPSNLKQEEV